MKFAIISFIFLAMLSACEPAPQSTQTNQPLAIKEMGMDNVSTFSPEKNVRCYVLYRHKNSTMSCVHIPENQTK
jgi:hypothetical protein